MRARSVVFDGFAVLRFMVPAMAAVIAGLVPGRPSPARMEIGPISAPGGADGDAPGCATTPVASKHCHPEPPAPAVNWQAYAMIAALEHRCADVIT